ncbi:MAG: hypothetical protein ACK4RT_03030, partial [Erythrobacter sp.]
FARTYEGNVMSRARRLTEKHIQIGKREISDEVPLVEVSPRYSKADADPDPGGVATLPVPDAEAQSRQDTAE